MKYFNSAEEAYYHTLKEIKSKGKISSPRNRAAKELLAYSFTITNPRNRIITNKTRQINYKYLYANFFWVLSQSNELDFISKYNPNGYLFSDDGKTLRGAYGKRIFDFDGVNQFQQAINELKIDKDSRRAYISIHLPQHDWAGSLDTPCTAGFHVMIRENKLHMITHMRSQSALMVMPYDIFLMTMLQEYMALQLDVEVGDYTHFCDNIHFFEDEEEFANKVLENQEEGMSMSPMTNISYKELKDVFKCEKELRNNEEKGYLLYQIKNDYWRNLLKNLFI